MWRATGQTREIKEEKKLSQNNFEKCFDIYPRK